MCYSTDEEILQASVELSAVHGIFSEPAAAAAFAGMLKYRDEGNDPCGVEKCCTAYRQWA